MAQVASYTMLNVTATLDGLRVSGLFDGDDAITITPNADIGSLLVGADGSSVFSQSADRGAQIVMRLQPNSPTHRQLIQRWKAQRSGLIRGMPFDLIDSDSGEGGSTDKCFIFAAPEVQKGFNATERAWTLVTGDWTPTIPVEL